MGKNKNHSDGVREADEPDTMKASRHGFVTRSIHWLSAGLLIFGYIKGLDDVSQLADPDLLRFEVSFALILTALFVVRWLWTNYVAGVTRLPGSAPLWEKTVSRYVQIGLYISVFTITLSGLGIALGLQSPVLSGLIVAAMIGLHELGLSILPLLLLTHIIGAIWHKVVRKDGVLERMTGKLFSRG